MFSFVQVIVIFEQTESKSTGLNNMSVTIGPVDFVSVSPKSQEGIPLFVSRTCCLECNLTAVLPKLAKLHLRLFKEQIFTKERK